MDMGRTCSQARSQLLGLCVNVMGSTERIKKTRQTRDEMNGQHEQTSRKPMNQNSEEQGRLEEIHQVLKIVAHAREGK